MRCDRYKQIVNFNVISRFYNLGQCLMYVHNNNINVNKLNTGTKNNTQPKNVYKRPLIIPGTYFD